MRRHHFRGKDLREALAMVRETLGPEAVIFATRRVADGAGESLVEVEAAEWLEEGGLGPSGPGGDDPAAEAPPPPARRPRVRFPRDLTRSTVFNELCESGLREETARELLLRAAGDLPAAEGEDPVRLLRERVASLITLLFEVGGPVRARRPGDREPSVANFIGPTGAGKTMTIAKIAAECTHGRRLRVGLIALEPSRVGAVEQLKAYAGLIRLPLIAARSAGEVDAALGKFRRADVVLVDTPGESLGDASRMAELVGLFGPGRPGKNYLVLAANTHPDDMARMGERFSCVPLHRLVFTKLDESSRFGVIFERHMELGVRVAYFTAGQRVPEDLEVATPSRMARLILSAGRRRTPAPGVPV